MKKKDREKKGREMKREKRGRKKKGNNLPLHTTGPEAQTPPLGSGRVGLAGCMS